MELKNFADDAERVMQGQVDFQPQPASVSKM